MGRKVEREETFASTELLSQPVRPNPWNFSFDHVNFLQYTIPTWKTMNSLIFVNLIWIKEILIPHIHIGYVRSTGFLCFFLVHFLVYWITVFSPAPFCLGMQHVCFCSPSLNLVPLENKYTVWWGHYFPVEQNTTKISWKHVINKSYYFLILSFIFDP